ncbi:hypothetical protein [Actinomadura sp. 3N508]|uniref:hypothetical protein n=1 Tax=Actinomadura sp. 3N508 TaxID=3375153 RepID=UPI00379A47BC
MALGNVRLRVLDLPSRASGNLAFNTLVPGDTLRSVSRRHSVRARANVWTSGNSVLTCPDSRLAATFLYQLGARTFPLTLRDATDTIVEFGIRHHIPLEDMRQAITKIDEIVTAEQAAYQTYCSGI